MCLDQLNGSRKEYYPGEKIREKALYKSDKLNGEVRRYWENGNLREKLYYVDGEQYGDIVEYTEDGEIRKEKKLSLLDKIFLWRAKKKQEKMEIDSSIGGIRG